MLIVACCVAHGFARRSWGMHSCVSESLPARALCSKCSFF